MGDFNAVANPTTDRSCPPQSFRPYWTPEIPLFEFLEDWQLTDTQKLWEDEEYSSPTWSNGRASSRIDYI